MNEHNTCGGSRSILHPLLTLLLDLDVARRFAAQLPQARLLKRLRMPTELYAPIFSDTQYAPSSLVERPYPVQYSYY